MITLLTLMLGCAPGEVVVLDDDNVVVSAPGTTIEAEDCYQDLDGDGAYYPYGEDCHVPEGTTLDCDDGDPEMDAEECAETQGSPHESQEDEYGDEWAHTWFQFDLVPEGNGDSEHSLAVLFADGTWLTTENGWFEVAPSDPTTVSMVVDMSTSEVLDNEFVADGLTVEMLTEAYEDLGPMQLVDSLDALTYVP